VRRSRHSGGELAEATRVVSVARLRLRRDRDPAGALLVLDRYLARHPRGPMAHEVRLARIDALLGLAALSAITSGDDDLSPRALARADLGADPYPLRRTGARSVAQRTTDTARVRPMR
jgi:hypothetical protein